MAGGRAVTGRRAWLAVALAVVAVAGAACSSSGEASPSPSTTGIAVTLSDFKIKPAETETPAGSVTFDLTNDGPSDHTFFMAKTDLADDALPVADHLVQVDQLDVVAEIDTFPAGTDQSLTVDLQPGAYVMFCNLTGHYESDMHTAFTVTKG
jgi:uncharacterized cupredoxin-like copper-binding protein